MREFVGMLGLEPRYSESEPDVLAIRRHSSENFVGLVRLELTISSLRAKCFNHLAIDPCLRIVGPEGIEPSVLSRQIKSLLSDH